MSEQTDITAADFTRAALRAVAENTVYPNRMADAPWRARQREVLTEFERLGALFAASEDYSPFVRAIGAALTSAAGTWPTEDPADANKGGGAGYRLVCAVNVVSAAVQKACRLSPPESGELASMRSSEDRFLQCLAGAIDRPTS
jgi:hypothetical protein